MYVFVYDVHGFHVYTEVCVCPIASVCISCYVNSMHRNYSAARTAMRILQYFTGGKRLAGRGADSMALTERRRPAAGRCTASYSTESEIWRGSQWRGRVREMDV